MGRTKGVVFSKGDHSRLPGKMQIHERLRFDEHGRPKLQVFNTCKEFIRTVPTLPYSTKKPEDVDSDAEDHIFTMNFGMSAWTIRSRLPGNLRGNTNRGVRLVKKISGAA